MAPKHRYSSFSSSMVATFNCTLLLLLIGGVTSLVVPSNHIDVVDTESRSLPSEFSGGVLHDARALYHECTNSVNGVVSCLTGRLAKQLNRLAHAPQDVNLGAGIRLVRDPHSVPAAASGKEESVEQFEARSNSMSDDELHRSIANSVSSLIQKYTVQIKLGGGEERSLGEERGKKKKSSGLLILPLILGGTLIPLALGALALLAGKALIISKLALVLAGIIGLKKLLGGGGSDHGAPHEYTPAVHTSGWARTLDKSQSPDAAHKIAYSAYATSHKSR